jgi:hypothetical protein
MQFVTGQRIPTSAQGLAGCFAAIEGEPAKVLFDNAEDRSSAGSGAAVSATY